MINIDYMLIWCPPPFLLPPSPIRRTQTEHWTEKITIMTRRPFHTTNNCGIIGLYRLPCVKLLFNGKDTPAPRRQRMCIIFGLYEFVEIFSKRQTFTDHAFLWKSLQQKVPCSCNSRSSVSYQFVICVPVNIIRRGKLFATMPFRWGN